MSEAYCEVYREFLALGFALPNLRFTSLVVDTDLMGQAEMQKYHASGGKKEAYLKFMRLLISKRLPVMLKKGDLAYTLLWDKQPVKADMTKVFREVLLNDMWRFAGESGLDCRYEHLSQANSAITHLLQLTDLLTGATWTAWEGEPGTGQATARAMLTADIEGWAKTTLSDEGRGPARFYNLWRWRPSAPVSGQFSGENL